MIVLPLNMCYPHPPAHVPTLSAGIVWGRGRVPTNLSILGRIYNAIMYYLICSCMPVSSVVALLPLPMRVLPLPLSLLLCEFKWFGWFGWLSESVGSKIVRPRPVANLGSWIRARIKMIRKWFGFPAPPHQLNTCWILWNTVCCGLTISFCISSLSFWEQSFFVLYKHHAVHDGNLTPMMLACRWGVLFCWCCYF